MGTCYVRLVVGDWVGTRLEAIREVDGRAWSLVHDAGDCADDRGLAAIRWGFRNVGGFIV